MIQINKELNTKDGGVIASGSIVVYQTIFHVGLKITYRILVYRSVDDFENGKMPIENIVELGQGYDRVMTEQEYDALNTETGVFDTVQGWLKTIIDEIIGVGYTELI
jgi:hypothetical protein